MGCILFAICFQGRSLHNQKRALWSKTKGTWAEFWARCNLKLISNGQVHYSTIRTTREHDERIKDTC